MKYVIIGNSTAAVGCVEGIRTADREGEITLIASEPYHTYSRPLISYLLEGKATRESMQYRPADFYEKNRVTAMLGRTAKEIDPDEKNVVLEDGGRIPYDKLLIATGSVPLVPPIEGLNGVERQFTFQSLDDAEALDAALFPGCRVLIVGAGLIGLKCAEGIHQKAGHITVVDLANRILPSVLDEEASRMVQRHIEAHGVEIILEDSAVRFREQEAELQSGRRIPFDILVMAAGVRPCVSLAKEAGCKIGRGVRIGRHCETSVPDLYAAGDCAEGIDALTGEQKVLAILPGAYLQGECAGKSMAGQNAVFDRGMAMNAVGFFGLHILTAGDGDGEAIVSRGPGEYKKLVVKDGLLRGFILVGSIARAGIYTAMIREQTPVSTVDFQLLREKPQLLAFDRQERKKQLAAAH